MTAEKNGRRVDTLRGRRVSLIGRIRAWLHLLAAAMDDPEALIAFFRSLR